MKRQIVALVCSALAVASCGGSSTTGTFSSGGTGTAIVTVTDGKGGSATDSRTFIVGTASGNWTGSGQGASPTGRCAAR